MLSIVICSLLPLAAGAADVQTGLWAHWPLAGDTRDHSGNGHHAINAGGDLTATGPNGKPAGAIALDGHQAFLQVPAAFAPQLGKRDFSVSVWMHTEAEMDDVPGDILSQYDPARKRGFHLTLKSNAGVTFNQANFKQLQFGIDDDRESEWIDCGRPGDSILPFGLAVHDGHLYAGVCRPGKDDSGHVFRYAGGSDWQDCGAPDRSNAVTALASFDGHLYAGTGKYRLAGSSLPESENPHVGGGIFRYVGDQNWVACGAVPDAEAVAGLAVYRGRMYAASLYKPAGFYRYEGGSRWSDCGVPDGMRVEALGVYNGHLYATSYDAGRVFRYDGQSWTDCGQLGDAATNTQTYAFAVFRGRLHVGTWRSGRVYRFEGLDTWLDVGRLGEELEVMGMLVHNGRLLAGTLPLAEVYSYQGGDSWQRLVQIDRTPDVRYRRAWTMAEFQGRLFCSALPSGHIFSYRVGRSVMWDREFPAGWNHVAAVKAGGQLRLYVSGRLVGTTSEFDPADFDLDSERPLRIGLGENDHFCGRLSDLRLYRRALDADEIGELARRP